MDFPEKNHPFWSILGIPIYGHRHDFRSFWDLSKGACHLDALAGQPSRARTGGVIVYVSPKDCHLNRKHGWNWNTKYTMGSGCFLFRHWIFWMFFFPLNVQTKTSGAFTVPNLVLFFIQEITRGHLSESSCARKRKNTCQSGTLDPKPPLVSGFFWMDSEQWRFLLNGN